MQLMINEKDLPILWQFSEEGFVDCVFKISGLRSDEKRLYFHMEATFEGSPVGVDVSMVRGIKAGFNEEMELDPNHVYRKGVCFSRSGVESDRLIMALAKLYELDLRVEKMIGRETFTAIALHQGEIDAELEPVKIKLFGKDSDADNEDDYYESFFNLDLQNRLVFWNEKDQEFRHPLIRALALNAA